MPIRQPSISQRRFRLVLALRIRQLAKHVYKVGSIGLEDFERHTHTSLLLCPIDCYSIPDALEESDRHPVSRVSSFHQRFPRYL